MPPVRGAPDESEMLVFSLSVYSMPSVVTPTVLYSGSPGSCSAISKAALDSYLMSFSFYDLSGATLLSPSQFVASTTVQVL